MKDITLKQRQILEFIESHAREEGSSPTVREIARRFSISIGPAQRHLRALIAKGALRHRPGAARGIDPSFRRAVSQVPVLGRVRAGEPDMPAEIEAERLPVPDDVIARGGEHFALSVRGDSMTGSGIMEGDTVVVRRQDHAAHGDIVVAMVDGQAAVKRLCRRDGAVYLESTNPLYAPIHGEIRIIGRVVYLSRRLGRG